LLGGRRQAEQLGPDDRITRLTKELHDASHGEPTVPAGGSDAGNVPLVTPTLQRGFTHPDGSRNLFGGQQVLHETNS
jgi:hypothetical protein